MLTVSRISRIRADKHHEGQFAHPRVSAMQTVHICAPREEFHAATSVSWGTADHRGPAGNRQPERLPADSRGSSEAKTPGESASIEQHPDRGARRMQLRFEIEWTHGQKIFIMVLFP